MMEMTFTAGFDRMVVNIIQPAIDKINQKCQLLNQGIKLTHFYQKEPQEIKVYFNIREIPFNLDENKPSFFFKFHTTKEMVEYTSKNSYYGHYKTNYFCSDKDEREALSREFFRFQSLNNNLIEGLINKYVERVLGDVLKIKQL